MGKWFRIYFFFFKDQLGLTLIVVTPTLNLPVVFRDPIAYKTAVASLIFSSVGSLIHPTIQAFYMLFWSGCLLTASRYFATFQNLLMLSIAWIWKRCLQTPSGCAFHSLFSKTCWGLELVTVVSFGPPWTMKERTLCADLIDCMFAVRNWNEDLDLSKRMVSFVEVSRTGKLKSQIIHRYPSGFPKEHCIHRTFSESHTVKNTYFTCFAVWNRNS